MSDDSGLKPEVIALILATFAHFSAIRRVILYGSRARGNYRPGSDIDLTFEAAEDHVIDLTLLLAIDQALDDLMLPYSFDLSVLKDIDNPALLGHIHRVGVVFYEKQSAP